LGDGLRVGLLRDVRHWRIRAASVVERSDSIGVCHDSRLAYLLEPLETRLADIVRKCRDTGDAITSRTTTDRLELKTFYEVGKEKGEDFSPPLISLNESAVTALREA
jgi:hypothetical protein